MNADPKRAAADRKAIAVFVDASPSGQRRAAHAGAIALRWGADVVGVQVVGPEMMPGYMYNARGDTAAEAVISYQRRLATDARAAEQLAQHPHSARRQRRCSSSSLELRLAHPRWCPTRRSSAQ